MELYQIRDDTGVIDDFDDVDEAWTKFNVYREGKEGVPDQKGDLLLIHVLDVLN